MDHSFHQQTLLLSLTFTLSLSHYMKERNFEGVQKVVCLLFKGLARQTSTRPFNTTKIQGKKEILSMKVKSGHEEGMKEMDALLKPVKETSCETSHERQTLFSDRRTEVESNEKWVAVNEREWELKGYSIEILSHSWWVRFSIMSETPKSFSKEQQDDVD